MSGLREQQRALRREAIAKAAIGLFRSQGFASTTIEQIARLAGVSAPTVFKYFGSKQEIILEMLKEADRRALLTTRQRNWNMEEPLEVLCELEQLIVGYALDMLTPALWRELLPMILCGGTEGLPHAYRQLNNALLEEISDVLRRMQAAGTLRADLDVKLAAFMLNDYSHLQLLRLVQSDEPDLEKHRLNVRQTTGLVFRGMCAV